MNTTAKLFTNVGIFLIYLACGVWGIVFAAAVGGVFYSTDIPTSIVDWIINLTYDCIPSISFMLAQGTVIYIVKGLVLLFFATGIFLSLLGLGGIFVDAGTQLEKKDFSFIWGWIFGFVLICSFGYVLITYPVSSIC